MFFGIFTGIHLMVAACLKLYNVFDLFSCSLQGNVTMLGVDGSTNVFVKKGDVDIQVRQMYYCNKVPLC